MNKNIKFINLDKESDIKIITYSTDKNINELNINNLEENRERIKINYALSSEKNFFKVLNRLFNKLVNKYNNSYNFVININTMINEFNKDSDIVYDIPFTSIKEVFISAKELDLKIIYTENTKIEFHSIFKAFTRTMNKDILEYIIDFSFINYNLIKMHIKIRRHLYNDKKYYAGFDIYNFNISYNINNIEKYDLSGIFNYILDPIQNISKLLDYKRRDKAEKELYENMESNIIYNIEEDNVKLVKTIAKYNQINDTYDNSKKELKGSILNSHEIFKQEYFNSEIDDENDLISIAFKAKNKEKLLDIMVDTNQFIIDVSEYYGINRQKIFRTSEKNKYAGLAISKCLDIVKLNKNIPIPIKYKVILGIDIKQKILNLEVSLNYPDSVKEILSNIYNKSILEFNMNRLVDIKQYFNINNEEEISKLLELETRYNINKEIKNEIDTVIKNNDIDNLDESIKDLANIVLNKNILYKVLCDVDKISNLF